MPEKLVAIFKEGWSLNGKVDAMMMGASTMRQNCLEGCCLKMGLVLWSLRS